MVTYTFRPLGPWVEGDTSPRRGAHLFRATWDDTLKLLERELGYLDGRNIVIQADFREGDLRLDGMPRADARQPNHPGVRLAFDSVHGPLTYATDAYEKLYSGPSLKGWQANVRAIALALEALRAVDRYGVTRRGEQYTGWKQLEAGRGDAASHMTSDEARKVLAQAAGGDTDFGGSPMPLGALHRRARALAHPDRHGGDRTAWDRVEQAARVLGAQS